MKKRRNRLLSDIDMDGVPDIFDCQPCDPEKDGVFGWLFPSRTHAYNPRAWVGQTHTLKPRSWRTQNPEYSFFAKEYKKMYNLEYRGGIHKHPASYLPRSKVVRGARNLYQSSNPYHSSAPIITNGNRKRTIPRGLYSYYNKLPPGMRAEPGRVKHKHYTKEELIKHKIHRNIQEGGTKGVLKSVRSHPEYFKKGSPLRQKYKYQIEEAAKSLGPGWRHTKFAQEFKDIIWRKPTEKVIYKKPKNRVIHNK